jgi:hypothetical protein
MGRRTLEVRLERTLEVPRLDLPAVVREMPVAFPYDFYGPGLLEHNLGWID